MKSKIFLFIAGVLFFVSCTEDFITRDLDKGSYDPGSFFISKARADQALIGAYTSLQSQYGQTWGGVHVMHMALSDDLYETSKAAGFSPWNNIINLRINANDVNDPWNAWYAAIQRCNTALDNMKNAQAVDANFTKADLDLMEGQAYFLRGFYYYSLFDYYPKDKIVLRNTQVLNSDLDFVKAPSTEAETFAFIEADLKKAQELLVNGTNTKYGTTDKWRASRGAATALLGKLYLNKKDYAKAAAEFKKILPGVGDAAYGTYALADYRANFTKAGANNSESIFEVEFADVATPSNQRGGGVQNWSWNDHNAWIKMAWNFAVPTYKLNDFESWTETIDGKPTTVYDYRVYASLLGVPNGANLTLGTRTVNWIEQGWYKVDGVDYTGLKTGNGADLLTASFPIIGGSGSYGSFGIRKRAHESDASLPNSDATSTVIPLRLIRLSDIMLNYAECLANINSSKLSATDVESGVYWVDMVRNRANNVMTGDQSHLYSARPGVKGQLPTTTQLMASKSWTLMQAIEHERYVEGYGEAWRREDLKRWQKDANFVKNKSGWTGWQSLILPIPQQELDRNALMPR